MSTFIELAAKVDELLGSAGAVERLPELRTLIVGNGALQRYFFERLKDPNWVGPLAAAEFFSDPPSPIATDDGIRTPDWPAADYLKRMADLAPEEVMKTIRKVPRNENARVHGDFAEAALSDHMPVKSIAAWAKEETEWISSQELLYLNLPRRLGEVISRLARGGEPDAALGLARELLKVLPTSQKNRSSAETIPPEPRARFDLWEYEQILQKDIPDLVDAAGEKAFDLLCSLLDEALQIPHRGDGPQQDYSYIWRPAVEDHDQNLNLGLKPLLVTAARDAAVKLAQQDRDISARLVAYLEERGKSWLVFQRIALHLLRLFPDPAQIADRLTDRRLFDEVGVRHEYVLLLEEYFSKLSREQQNTILGWIERGPDVPNLPASLEKHMGKRMTSDQVERFRRSWQLERLAPISSHLQGEWRERYQGLVGEAATPEHPEFPVYTTGWTFGPTTPKSSDDLRNMEIDELVAYLSEWRPTTTNSLQDATPEGLGRALATLVSAEPGRYADHADSFRLAEPTYVRSVLSGFLEALKQGQKFSWEMILRLCNWPVQDPMTRDPNWREARKVVLWLVSGGLESQSCALPFELRESVWKVLEALTLDPDPAPEDERHALFDTSTTPLREAGLNVRNLDVLTFSINTVRGEALSTVVAYARWIHRNFEKQPDGKEHIAVGFNALPEVQKTLDDHLDPDSEPSLAVRATYGRAIPWLYQLDPLWTKAAVARIFPLDPDYSSLWEAAWEAYIASWPAYDDLFDALREHYGRAIERIGRWSDALERIVNLDERLAHHLMTLNWRGKLDPEPRLLDLFYQKADEKLRGEAMHFVGWSLYSMKDEVPGEILGRLQRFWEKRLRLVTAKNSAQSQLDKEVAQFGWWFASGKFDDEWALGELAKALRISGYAEPDHLVVGRLAELSQRFPLEAVKCLALIVEEDKRRWGILGWPDKARTIVEQALRSGSAEARNEGMLLANRLASLGNFEYIDLIKQSTGGDVK